MTDLTAHHQGVTVHDLDRAVTFYRDTLGLDEVARFSVSGEAFATVVDEPGASGEFVHLDAGDVRLELVAYDPAGADRTGGDLTDPGTAHLAFGVDDVDTRYEALADEVETVSEPQTTASGTRLVFCRDPEGNLVELLET